MIRVVAYIRPHRLEGVKSAIAALGVTGMTVGDARGRGNSEERSRWMDGEERVVALPIRSRLEVVAPDALQEPIIAAILENAQTGESGDGKVFISRVIDAIRVRTGERGDVGL